MIENFDKRQIRARLIDGPLNDEDSLFEDLRGMGFDSEGDWIVNPYWSRCGRFQVEPLEEYGNIFLEAPIASYLGFERPSL